MVDYPEQVEEDDPQEEDDARNRQRSDADGSKCRGIGAKADKKAKGKIEVTVGVIRPIADM